MLGAFDQRRYMIPFRSQLLPHIFTDTLVLGGGVAGLRAAIEASSGGDVIVLMKGDSDLSATAWAQGGVAAAHAPDDTAAAHFDDTMTAGAGLCDAAAVRMVVESGPRCIDELLAHGARFDRDTQGRLHYGREGGHLADRILHTDGAATGREIVRCLTNWLQARENVRVFDHCFALDLLTIDVPDERGSGRVLGAITHHPRYGLQIIWARTTILATGGAGQLYRETTNPRIATGDGIAMAWRAGAQVGDLEFVQFHPTTLYIAGAARQLISEAVRGEGAHLVTRDGRRFMPEYHPLAELAPRDIVSRAIVDQLARSQEACVYLDARHLDGRAFERRFPELVRDLLAFELDPAEDLIPVHPSAHYTIGGVVTDMDGRTTLPGLLACGETSCTGLHGANRLASNSLLEGLVFGQRVGAIAASTTAPTASPARIISSIPPTEHAELDLVDVRSSLRSAMWRNVGIRRHGRKLQDVLEMVTFWARYTMDVVFDETDGWELQNLLTVGALVTRAALAREESRGTHDRTDFPETKSALCRHARWRIGETIPQLIPVDLSPPPKVCS